ncbi:hypothetical protein L915_09149 [Phytophthora nicotianae]|uniref:Uncharacterized protein n=1 Tax=Phytophthora nicotianae TaxID=4792 RepID=W2GV32_PHYNI|nr:hypothetical protein L915_09149 [Phytophthora nicotianae]
MASNRECDDGRDLLVARGYAGAGVMDQAEVAEVVEAQLREWRKIYEHETVDGAGQQTTRRDDDGGTPRCIEAVMATELRRRDEERARVLAVKARDEERERMRAVEGKGSVRSVSSVRKLAD